MLPIEQIKLSKFTTVKKLKKYLSKFPEESKVAICHFDENGFVLSNLCMCNSHIVTNYYDKKIIALHTNTYKQIIGEKK